MVAAAAGDTVARRWSRGEPTPLPYMLRWELAIPRPTGPLRRALAARAGERILEIGPGLGQHAVEVAGYVGPEGRVDVLDVQQEMLDATAARLVEDGLAAWGGGEAEDRALIVRGRANLLEEAGAAEDLERVRSLFEDLEQKEQLIQLLDGVREGQGVRIFIGAETRLFSLSGSAVIAAPYMTGSQRVLGAIGVIGPARLNYARIIPLVDYTARVLGQVMNA